MEPIFPITSELLTMISFLSKETENRLVHCFDITPLEYRFLVVLNQNHLFKLSQKRISMLLSIGPSTASELRQKLENKGYVGTETAYAKTFSYLNSEGKNRLNEINGYLHASFESLLSAVKNGQILKSIDNPLQGTNFAVKNSMPVSLEPVRVDDICRALIEPDLTIKHELSASHITKNEYRVLLGLLHSGGYEQLNEVAHKLQLNQSTLTRVYQKLGNEEKLFCNASILDKREKTIELTSTGFSILFYTTPSLGQSLMKSIPFTEETPQSAYLTIADRLVFLLQTKPSVVHSLMRS